MSDKEEPPAQEHAAIETKRSIRKKVWDYMEKNDLCNYPRPTTGRIPNFKGADEAAEKLSQLDVFKAANVIKVNPDKPQEALRFLALQAKKKLVIPIPRLRTGLFQLVELPEEAGLKEMKIAASRRGAEQYGAAIGVGSDVKANLVVVGAVAVSHLGQRIGKGEGFADLEYGMLAGMGALAPDTIVVATVHDSQVFDSLPAHLFEPYDVPIDIIVTPTQVIYVTPRAVKPKGIIWRFLSQRRVTAISILQTFRDSQIALGMDCTLKEVDSEVEERPPRVSNGRAASGGGGDAKPRVRRRRVRSAKVVGEENGEPRKAGEGDEEPPRPARAQRRRGNSTRKPKEGEEEGAESGDRVRRRPVRPRQRPAIEFSLRVGNISSDARVRDLKNALAERGVKPSDITWRGQRGFAYLHFCAAKPGKEPPAEPVDPLDSNRIVASLQDMRLVSEGGEETALKIEPAKPVTRIETTDITAV